MGSTLQGTVAGIALAVLLAACGAGPVPPEASPSPSAGSPSATTATDVPAPTPSARPSNAPTPSPQPPPPPQPAPPHPTLPSDLAGRIVTVLPTSAKVVALTFDGGASDTGVTSILQTLAAQQVPATFFPTGDFARRYPDRVRAMAQAGHLVGNHSNTHPDFTTLRPTEQTAQLGMADAAIRPLTATPTAPWFRFPYGASTPANITTINADGYATIGWTVDTLGWKGTSEGQSVDSVVSRVIQTARPGQIVLLHVGAHPKDGSTLDADALPRIIQGLRGLGYGFVTLAAAQ